MGHCLHFVALPLTFASCHFRIFAASPRTKWCLLFNIVYRQSRTPTSTHQHTHTHKQTQANTHPSWPVSRLQHCGRQRRLCHDSYSLITKVNMGTSLIRHVCQQQQCLLRLLFYFLLIEFEFRRLRCTHILLKYCTHKEREWGKERESGADREGAAIGTLSSSFDGCRCHTSYFNGRVLLPIWLIEQAGRQADRHLLLHATKLVGICLTCIVWVHSEISIELQNLFRPPSPPATKM